MKVDLFLISTDFGLVYFFCIMPTEDAYFAFQPALSYLRFAYDLILRPVSPKHVTNRTLNFEYSSIILLSFELTQFTR